jgi:hypothetical protein
MTMTKQAGELPQSASCEIPEEQLIGITRELVRCLRVFEGHGAPPRAIWLETLVAECLERLECSGRFEELSVLSDEASRLRSITLPRRYARLRGKAPILLKQQ